jgi:ferritin-like metal-binding protein YciE
MPISWRITLIHPTASAPLGFRSLAAPIYRGSTTLFDHAAELHEGWQHETPYSYGLYDTPTTLELAARSQGQRRPGLPTGQAATPADVRLTAWRLAWIMPLVQAMPRIGRTRGKEPRMAITTPRELFVHELSDAMSAEQQILKMLRELQREALNAELKQALKEHEAETKGHVKNLQAVFTQIGEKPEETTCFGVKGLADEHAAMHEEDPSPEMLELANLSGAEKTEHYERVMYTGLVQMAKDLGETESAALLQDNLDQEKAMAKRVEALAKDLGKQAKVTETKTAASQGSRKAAR